MLMVERYPRLLVQDQADHIHALGWEFLARYIYINIYINKTFDMFFGFMLLCCHAGYTV
jgi:hypothetical protein